MDNRRAEQTSLKYSVVLIVAAITVLIAVLCSVVIYQGNAISRTKNETYAKLNSVAEEEASSINDSLNSEFLILQSFAQSVTHRNWLSEEDMMGSMKSITDATIFTRMWNIDSNGLGFSQMGDRGDFSERAYFHDALSGKTALSRVTDSVVDDGVYFILAVPVIGVDGTVTGVVSGSVSEENFCGMMDTEMSYEGGYSFICYPTGHIIVKSAHNENFIEGANIETTILGAQIDDDTDLDVFFDDLTQQRSGNIAYTVDGESRYAVYSPLGINNWTLFTVVPGEYVTKIVSDATRSGLLTMGFVLLLCLLLVGLIVFVNRRQNERLKKEYARVHFSEERFRIAIENTNVSIWDYDVKKREIIQSENSIRQHGGRRVVRNVPDSLIDSGFIHPDSEETFREFFRKLENGEKKAEAIVRMRQADAEGYWYEHIRFTSFFDAAGVPVRAIGVSEDVTEKYLAKADYERELRLQQVLAPDVYATALFDVTERTVVKTQFKSREEFELFKEASFDNYFSISAERVKDDNAVKSFLQGVGVKFLTECFQKKQTNFTFDFLRIMADDTDRWVHEDIHLMEDPDSGHLMLFLCVKDVDTEKKRIDKLSLAAETDAMTGLLNHDVTLRQIEQYLAGEGKEGSHALFMVDIDFFKEVNDVVGHQAGDDVIIRVSDGIRHLFRADDVIGRMGGDEFLVLMKNVPTAEIAAHKAAELVDNLQFTCSGGGRTINVSSSVGAVFFRDDGSKTAPELYRAVDGALYMAKEGGRSKYYLSDELGSLLEGEPVVPSAAAMAGIISDSAAATTIQLQAIMEYIDGFIFIMEIGEEFRTLYISPSFYKTAGASEAKAVAAGADIMSFIHPDDLDEFKSECRKYAASGEPWDCTYRVVLSDGSIGWHHGRAVTIPYEGSKYPVMIDVVTNVTDMMQASARLDAILNNSPVGIAQFTLGTGASFAFANDEFVKMCGVTREYFDKRVAPDATRLIPVEEQTTVATRLRSAKRGGESVEYIHKYVNPLAGSEHYFSVRAILLEESRDGDKTFLAIFLDVTEQIKLERALADSRRPVYISAKQDDAREVRKQAVLVVDDSNINRKILRKILADEYVVLEAENGFDALSVLRRHVSEINAVLLDLVMPKMNGFKFLEEKNKEESLKDVPVIVVTGNSDVETETRVLREGAWDYIVKPFSPEIVKFRLSNVITRSQLTAFNRLQYLAEFDELTGIFNRQKFFSATKEMLLLNPDEKFAFIRFDINRFGLVNTYYGTEEGDRVLKYLAGKMREASREMDKCTYGRVESDVFGICVSYTDTATLEGFFSYTKKVLDKYGLELDMVPAFGVCLVEDHDMSVDQLYDNACLAAKRCKGSYIQNFCYYDESMGDAIAKEQEIVDGMNNALEMGQFVVHLQPKINLITGRIEGAEALVRWDDPARGLIQPNDFIPIFESNGFISKLDLFVWDFTCRLIRRWLDEGKEPIPVSANVSRVNLYSAHFLDTICGLTDKYNIPRELFNLELTESAYMDNPGAMLRIIRELRARGFTVMMDDFGSGFSSLNSLKDIKVDVLKIDLRFLSDTEDPERGRHIIRSVVEMAQALDMVVVAEGVEKGEQVKFLKDIGCDYVQGFFYARPMPVDEFEQKIMDE